MIIQDSEEELKELFSLAGLKIEKYMCSISENHNFMLAKK